MAHSDTAVSDTAAPTTASSSTSLAKALSGLGSVEIFTVGLVVVALLQAVWLAILMHAGWYYQADFDNLAAATGSSLNWSYLTASQGGHLDVVGRLVLWLLNRTVPLNYGATIALRAVASAVVTYLLGRLLRELVGPRRGLLALVVLFALSPLLVQSTLWLTSAINFLLSELLVLAALRSHVRYAVTGRLRWAACTGAAMLAATLVAEQAAVTALALPVLTFAFLSEGSVRDRLRAVRRSWAAWLMIGVPILAFAVFYFASGKYATKAGGFTIGDAVGLVRAFWFDTLVPGLFGGPLAWSTLGGNFFAFSDPPIAERVVAVALLVLVVAWTVRRTSLWALWGWAIPALVSGIGLVFVGRARFELFGGFSVSRHFEYASYAAVPAAVGVALAIWPVSLVDVRARIAGARTPIDERPKPSRHAILRRWPARGVVVAVALLSAISAGTYAQHWSQSPAKAYVARLSAGLSEEGSEATVFDTFVAGDVMPAIQDHRHVSDLLALMGSHASLNNGPIPARVVSSAGNLVPAGFLTTASVRIPHSNPFCNDLYAGQTPKTQRLNRVPHLNEWFVRLTYFEQRPSILDVQAVTANGTVITPVGGGQVLLSTRVGNVYLLLPQSQPVAVRIQGATLATNVCLTGITVGYPFPTGK